MSRTGFHQKKILLKKIHKKIIKIKNSIQKIHKKKEKKRFHQKKTTNLNKNHNLKKNYQLKSNQETNRVDH